VIGASTILGNFALRLGLEANDYGRGVLQAQAWTQAFGATVTSFLTNPLLGAVQVLKRAGAGALRLGQDVTSGAEAVQRLGQQTGLTTELLQALNARMDVAGFSAERGARAMLNLAKNMERARSDGGPLAEVFERLGVDLDNIESMDAALAQVMEGLSRIGDEAERTAVGMEVLGRMAGPDVINAINGGREAVAEMIDEGRRLGLVYGTEAVDSLAAFNTTVGYSQLALRGIKEQLAVQFLQGFLGELDHGTEGVLSMSESINNELGPSMRRLGRDIGEAAAGVQQLVDNLNNLFELARQNREGLSAIGEIVGQGKFGGYDVPVFRQARQSFDEAAGLLGWMDRNLDFLFPPGGR
jgi:hypothetical protein